MLGDSQQCLGARNALSNLAGQLPGFAEVPLRRTTNSVYQEITLKLPARKTVALCLFQAQRRPISAAKKFLREFRPKRELSKVPPALRRIIVNMGGATLVLGNIDLPRHEKHDLAVLRNENELLGTILNDRFDLETFYGRLELPGFAQAEPVLRAYLDSIRGYQKNRYALNDEVIEKVNREWGFAFEAWGYERVRVGSAGPVMGG